MRKIAFHVQKGGVGKTTVSGNIAAALAIQGYRTVLVDCDPQGNCTGWYYNQPVSADLADVLKGDTKLATALVCVSDGLYLLPTIAIDGGLKDWSETRLNREPKAVEFLNLDLAASGFEYAIYDLSPGMSQLERAILADVDEIISPLTPEYFSMDGIETFVSELEKIKKNMRREILHQKLVCNNMNRSYSRHKKFFERFDQLAYDLYTIPQDALLAEAPIAHMSIFEYAPEAKSIRALKQLADAIVTGGHL